jgi:aspartate ammonia-lyase
MSGEIDEKVRRVRDFIADELENREAAGDSEYLQTAANVFQDFAAITAYLASSNARVLALEEALREIEKHSGFNGAPINSEEANYYATNCASIHEITRAALAPTAGDTE